MGAVNLRQLVDRLASIGQRQEAARQLADAMGARELRLFVLDQELQVMLPATGMPKTVAGGAAWREFLRRCAQEREVRAEIDLASGETLPAQAVVEAGCAFIAVGVPAAWRLNAEVAVALPLLGAVLAAQHAQLLLVAQAAESNRAAVRAHQLAKALDGARASAAELNDQLRHEHRRKDEFLAMLAHELRNPLAPVVSSVEILRRSNPLTPERLHKTLGVMTRQLQQLSHLVDDLLDVSRVSRGLIELRREVVSLDLVLAAAVDATRHALDARHHELRIASDPSGLWVNGDRVRLIQVFSNLLGNAVKYTPPRGQLRISLVPDGQRVSVVVQDNGVGIPPAMLHNIFDLFMQLPASLDRAAGGLGIGLTLVRMLVELHGGVVTAHSVGVGKGSTFTVTLPLVAAPRIVVRQPPEPVGTIAHARILLVDDNVDAAESLADALRLLGSEVVVAHDGAGALAHGDLDPALDLVLLDIGLPVMDGYETAREWRRRHGNGARLVALTGYGSPEDRQRTRQAGFDAHLVKPVELEQIAKLLPHPVTSTA